MGTKIIALFILYLQKKKLLCGSEAAWAELGWCWLHGLGGEECWHCSIWESPDRAPTSSPCLEGDAGAQGSAMETHQALGGVLGPGVVINPAAWHVSRVSRQHEDTDLGSVIFCSTRQLDFESRFCLQLC